MSLTLLVTRVTAHIGLGSAMSCTSTANITGVINPVGHKANVNPLAGVTLMISGSVVSRTVTGKSSVATLPDASVAVQVTVVLPSVNVDPLAGTQTAGTTPSCASSVDAA